MRTAIDRFSAADRLDGFLPRADVRERHEVVIRAPAALVLDVAKGFGLRSLAPVRAIFRLRACAMGSRRPPDPPRGIVEETLALGWGVLDEVPGRFFAAGAVCQPWLADVVFTPVAPSRFATYAVPDMVKIVWTLEAEPVGPGRTRFATETRAAGTNPEAKAKFLRYWRLAGFGIVLIRRLLLRGIRRAAERQAGRDLVRLHHSGGLPSGPESHP